MGAAVSVKGHHVRSERLAQVEGRWLVGRVEEGVPVVASVAVTRGIGTVTLGGETPGLRKILVGDGVRYALV